jgi:FkbM family methyltransferase
VRFALIRTLLVARSASGRKGGRRSVSVVEHGRRFRIFLDDASEFEVLREVFVEREYELELEKEPRVILDLGSNIGATIAYFRANHPAARIVGLEPDPSAFALLEANVGELENVTVVNVAAAGTDGSRSFYPAAQSWLSSLHSRRGGGEAIVVEARTVDSLLSELGIDHVDLLKIDVEGAEEEILPGFEGLADVDVVVGEIHPDVVDDPDGLIRRLDQRFDLEVERPLPDRWRFKGVRRDDAA